MCEENLQPSGVILRILLRLKIWKPPLSVRIGRSLLEGVESASFAKDVEAGAQVKMIGVAENDFGAYIFFEVTVIDALDRPHRANGHEDGGVDLSVVGVYNSRTGRRSRVGCCLHK